MPGTGRSYSGAPSGLVQMGQSNTAAEAESIDSHGQQMVMLVNQMRHLQEEVKTGVRKPEELKPLLAIMKSFETPKTEFDTESPEERKKWIDARRKFVEKYELSRPDYESWTRQVQTLCKEILEVSETLHQEPSSRTKKVESVKNKITKEMPRLRKEGNAEPMRLIYDRIVDLAGVRILVYFPDNVPKVAAAIDGSGKFTIKEAVVSFSRNRSDHRADDKEKQKDHVNSAGLNYAEGAWAEKSVGKDEIIHRWKNSGYRAAHLHVELKAQLRTNRNLKNQNNVQAGNEPGVAKTSSLREFTRVLETRSADSRSRHK